MCSELFLFLIIAEHGADSKDSAGKQNANGEDIAHHDDNWKSWQLELLWQKEVVVVLKETCNQSEKFK